MIKENSVFKLSKDILKRYEESIDNGVLFLYDVKTNEYWMGNKAARDLVKLIDGKNSIKYIYSMLKPNFPEFSELQIQESFDEIITELLLKKFIILQEGL